MPSPMQAELFGAQQPTTDPERTDKVLIPRAKLLAFADKCEQAGAKQKANAIRSGVFGHPDLVPVSRALVRLWGIEDGA